MIENQCDVRNFAVPEGGEPERLLPEQQTRNLLTASLITGREKPYTDS